MAIVTLEDIQITPLKRIGVLGGDVLHVLKESDPSYVDFGEAYFSFIEAGAIKAWKMHTKMTLNLVVPLGCVRFVFALRNNKYCFRVEEIGEERYFRLTVPPGIWFGFQGIASSHSLLLNIADILHNTQEVKRCEESEISYSW